MAGGLWEGFRVVYGGRRYELPSLLVSELSAIAEAGGVKKTYLAVIGAIEEMDLAVLNALAWVAMKRQDPTLKLADVDLDLAQLELHPYGDCGRHPAVAEQGPDGKPVYLPCPECAAEQAARGGEPVELVVDPTAAVTVTAPAAVSAPMAAVPAPIPTTPTS